MSLKTNRIVIFTLVILCIAAISCSERGGVFEDKEAKAIEGLELIGERLNNYFDKEGNYPEDISILKDEGFLSRFPFNPYVEGNKEMIQVRVSTPTAGDFSYLKIYKDDNSTEIMYYVLILWGEANHKGEDILDGAFDYDNFKFIGWESKPDGSPDRILKIIKSELRVKPASAERE